MIGKEIPSPTKSSAIGYFQEQSMPPDHYYSENNTEVNTSGSSLDHMHSHHGSGYDNNRRDRKAQGIITRSGPNSQRQTPTNKRGPNLGPINDEQYNCNNRSDYENHYQQNIPPLFAFPPVYQGGLANECIDAQAFGIWQNFGPNTGQKPFYNGGYNQHLPSPNDNQGFGNPAASRYSNNSGQPVTKSKKSLFKTKAKNQPKGNFTLRFECISTMNSSHSFRFYPKRIT